MPGKKTSIDEKKENKKQKNVLDGQKNIKTIHSAPQGIFQKCSVFGFFIPLLQLGKDDVEPLK